MRIRINGEFSKNLLFESIDNLLNERENAIGLQAGGEIYNGSPTNFEWQKSAENFIYKDIIRYTRLQACYKYDSQPGSKEHISFEPVARRAPRGGLCYMQCVISLNVSV